MCVCRRGRVIFRLDVCVREGSREGGGVPCFTVIIFTIFAPKFLNLFKQRFQVLVSYAICPYYLSALFFIFMQYDWEGYGAGVRGVCGDVDQINKFPSTPLRHPPFMMIKIFFPQNFSPFLIKFLIKEGSTRKLWSSCTESLIFENPPNLLGREFLLGFKTVVEHCSESLFEQ